MGRARAALRSRDFRLLLGSRFVSQLADGAFQAYLIDKLVFLSPDKQSTAVGVAKAFALLVIPFSLIGPLTGVVIDRWSRRRILILTPFIRAGAAVAILAGTGSASGPPLYALALIVVSLNRFFLATAGTVVPAMVPDQDLLVANSMASAVGTVVTFAGLVAGTQLAGPAGDRGLLAATVACWPAAAILAGMIRSPLRARKPGTAVTAELRRLAGELWSGARRIAATPVALGSMLTMSVDQFVVGLVTVLGVVVFKEQFNQGVASYGRILGAGGVGVLLGTLTVGLLEELLPKPQIVAISFAVAAAVVLAGSVRITGPSILAISFTLGLTYTWRKIPADTLIQESMPDRYRGRAFALYDLAFSMPRVLSAALAVLLIPHVSTGWIVAGCGVLLLVWIPALPAWARAPRWVGLRFYAGGRADQVPRSLVVAGDEEPIEVLGSWLVDRGSRRQLRYRLRAADRILDVEGGEGTERWRVRRETVLDPVRE